MNCPITFSAVCAGPQGDLVDSVNLVLGKDDKPVPIMLLVLPIIPSRISHNFYPLFYLLFLLYSLNFYCVSDNEVYSLFSS